MMLQRVHSSQQNMLHSWSRLEQTLLDMFHTKEPDSFLYMSQLCTEYKQEIQAVNNSQSHKANKCLRSSLPRWS